MDLVADGHDAEEVHRRRHRRAGAPLVPRGVVDPDTADDLLALEPAAEHPDLALEHRRGHRVDRLGQRRDLRPRLAGDVVRVDGLHRVDGIEPADRVDPVSEPDGREVRPRRGQRRQRPPRPAARVVGVDLAPVDLGRVPADHEERLPELGPGGGAELVGERREGAPPVGLGVEALEQVERATAVADHAGRDVDLAADLGRRRVAAAVRHRRRPRPDRAHLRVRAARARPREHARGGHDEQEREEPGDDEGDAAELPLRGILRAHACACDALPCARACDAGPGRERPRARPSCTRPSDCV